MADVQAARREMFAAVRAAPEEAWRDEPHHRKLRYAQRHGAILPEDASAPEVEAALERIFSSPDFLAGSWLTRGSKRCDSVARIITSGPKGTGFLVSPWLLITNEHVLEDATLAAEAEVTFRYEEDDRGRIGRSRKVRLDPGRCLVTRPRTELDYALVAVAPMPDGGPPGQVFGTIPMQGAVGKMMRGQPVNVIQHPNGRSREIAVRNNLLLGVDDARYLTYETDTEPGSSGAPVLNDQWELVAMHCSAESARNDRNEPVDIDGELVTANTPESRRVWVANKGIRVSAIIADLRSRTFEPSEGTDAASLVDELLVLGGNR